MQAGVVVGLAPVSKHARPVTEKCNRGGSEPEFATAARQQREFRLHVSDIEDLLMETLAMFSRFNALDLLRGSENRQSGREAHRKPMGHRSPNRCRRQFRLEGLEDRCLLAGISSITEFHLPSGSGVPDILQGITSAPDGNLWFTDNVANAIGMINPTTHAMSEFTVPTGSAPQGITAGPDGNIWFTEWPGEIGMINPTNHAITESAALPTLPDNPTVSAKPFAITAGPDGNLWFTQLLHRYIGEINRTTHAISEIYLPFAANSGWGITSGPDGAVWATESAMLAEINTTTEVATEFHVGSDLGIVTGPDGNLWIAAGGNGIRMFNPTTDAATLFSTAPASPQGITAGPDGNLWFTTESNQIGQFNPTTDAVTLYSVPYTDAAVYGITPGPDGNLWFTDRGTNAIGVTTLTTNQLVVTVQPPASVTAGSGFGLTVTAEDGSGNPITSFNGTVTVALEDNPGGATLGGTLTATASNGVANFSGLTLTKAAAGYTLVVSSAGIGEGVTSAITVTPAAATQLVIATQPPATVKVSTAFGMEALIEDQYGNVVTTANNTVTVALGNNPSKAALGGTLTVTANQGVVTFSGLTINQIGSGYTLVISSTGLGQAVTDPFNVTKRGT
jgi:streptogramin lyase